MTRVARPGISHRRWLLAVAVVLSALVLSLGWVLRGRPSVAVARQSASQAIAGPVRGNEPRAQRSAPRAVEPEARLMTRLRALGESDPPLSLRLALEGNVRFADSPDAPERGWILCKSLVNLRRFEEAVAEARLVVERYPNTPWALDVQRHLLSNPLTDPSERGYGQDSELASGK